MKQIRFLCLCAVQVFLSCTPSVVMEDAELDFIPVHTRTLSFHPQFVEFSGVGITDWQASRSGSLSELTTTLSYWDYIGGFCQGENTQVTSSLLSIDMDYGQHTLYFLAHSSNESVQDGFLFTPEKVTETFWKDFSLVVDYDTEESITVPLERVVSKVTVILKDAMPEGVSKMRMTVGGLIRTLDIKTGNGKTESSENYTLEWEIGPSYVGRKGLAFNMFTFTPNSSDEFEVSVKLEALSAVGEVKFSGECDSAPLLRNRCTQISCSLFGLSLGLSATVANDWMLPLEIDM